MSEKDPSTGNEETVAPEIDIDQILLQSRVLRLDGIVEVNTTKQLCGELLALDALSHEPIELRINSVGGSVDCGFAIIDTIFALKSPVYTYLCGTGSSMGALVFLAGQKRAMIKNSHWMIHEIVTGSYPDGEYLGKMDARVHQMFLPRQKMIENYLQKRTKLTKEEISSGMLTELHIWASEAKSKGIATIIVKERNSK